MKKPDGRPMAAIAALVAMATGACSHTTGPSLSAQLVSQQLVPTITMPQIVNTSGVGPISDPASLCCCRVVGAVRNTSSVPVNLNLFFHATTTDGQCPGDVQNTQNGCTGQDSLVNVAAGATVNYSAAGILKPCSAVSAVSLDMTVTGIWFPTTAP